MGNNFSVACIIWDQKKGGVLGHASPHINVSSAVAMNLYNMHRVITTKPSFGSIKIRLDNGDQYSVCSFFTGFGMSTSPDGFTGNYGKDTIGVAERVIALFLPYECKPSDYDEALAKIASRLVLDVEKLNERMDLISNLIKSSNRIEACEDINDIIDKQMDVALLLTPEEKELAHSYQIRALHYLIMDQKDHINELSVTVEKAMARNQKGGGNSGSSSASYSASSQILAPSAKFGASGISNEQINAAMGTATSELQDMTKSLDRMEKEGLRDEIRKINKLLKEKEEKIQDLERKTQDSAVAQAQATASQEIANKISELTSMLASKDKELNSWREKIAEMNENLFVNQDTISKMTEMSMMQSNEMQDLSRNNKTFRQENEQKNKEIADYKVKLQEYEDSIAKAIARIKDLEQENMRTKYTKISGQADQGNRTFIQSINQSTSQEKIGAPISDNIDEELEQMRVELEEEKAARKKCQMQLSEEKSQVIELKKNVKIQRREIEELQKQQPE
jgi:hypothetical protein